jgi:cobalt-zinc-cadmium efflux system membrane fusion protein
MAAMLVSGCTAAHSSQGSAELKPAAKDPLEITPPPALKARLKVGQPPVDSVAGVMEVPGRVQANEMRLARVSSTVTGRITELLVSEGEVVHNGQVLAKLYSTDLSAQQFAFLKSLSAKLVAERAVARANQLLAAEVIGAAELQRREAELAQINAELASARDQLRLLGVSPEEIALLEEKRTVNPEARIVASADGTLMERKVTIGQLVQPTEPAFVISDLAQLWLVADVPEQNAGGLRAGKSVEAEVAALPGHTIRGGLSFVNPIVTADTRTVRARMDLPNPSGLYKPAMLATMRMRDEPQPRTLIPQTAVVREDGGEFVFVGDPKGSFHMRKVALGADFNGRRVLVEGLARDEVIVLDGAFHLNNERRRALTQGAAESPTQGASE